MSAIFRLPSQEEPCQDFCKTVEFYYQKGPTTCNVWLLSMANPQGAPSFCKVVPAGSIAKGLLAEVSDGLKRLARPPHLLGILANADPAARLYAAWTEKTCKEK